MNSRRSVRAAEALERQGFRHVHILEGGMDAWEAPGLPVTFPEEVSERRPPALERQVRMAAGSLVLLFTALGLAVSPWFLGGSLFVGAGLALSGITNSCLMATLLCKLPWNPGDSLELCYGGGMSCSLSTDWTTLRSRCATWTHR